MEYFFEGNSGGYIALLKVDAPKGVLDKIIVDSQDLGIHEASYVYSGDKLLCNQMDDYECPVWFNLSPSTQIPIFQRKGQNGFTSHFTHYYFVDWVNETIYIEATGI